MPEQNDNDLEPTFGNCHGETLPESERGGNRKVTKIRKYGQVRSQADIDKQEDDQWWDDVKRNGLRDYERSRRLGR